VSISVQVTVRGPLFSKKIDKVVKDAMIQKCFKDVDKRLSRPPPKRKALLGMRRNPVKTRLETVAATNQIIKLHFEHVESRFHSPRRTGKAWVRKNIGIIKSIVRNTIKAVANQIASELS